jgi:hypothetical protein
MMTFHLYVLQHQWIVITLLIGLALVLVFCLTYQALWLPRGTEERSETVKVKDVKTFFIWITQFMPWVIVLLILASVSFTVLKIMENAQIPPNW